MIPSVWRIGRDKLEPAIRVAFRGAEEEEIEVELTVI